MLNQALFFAPLFLEPTLFIASLHLFFFSVLFPFLSCNLMPVSSRRLLSCILVSIGKSFYLLYFFSFLFLVPSFTPVRSTSGGGTISRRLKPFHSGTEMV
ncbi:hypothetical protein, partial [Bacteroides heparinolyticus]|uniref:hypothetical protein n=2 Tax=Prevotella heparinolytica TaxID=28113 RepID=UPI00359F7218